ncbi:hypothetical protein [Bacteroides sp. 224]|uniref:hypothetical protein n=1 Tax=Bacteroides sp. 224 TaxID=2302936 RepID=UPI0013D04244|nr:hypothetical protein [Bacteroides sp. 224]NDV63981.1 hypothetical protein [Bacteroides sp. 224]
MLTINQIKNVAIENISFAPNSLVLLKVRETESNGMINTTVNYIEVCELKDTKELTIVQNLLRYCLAEFNVSKGFESDFKETGIRQRRILQPFLNTKVLFRTDSTGKISRALISEIEFNKTAMNIKHNHAIVTAKPENTKAAIFQHSKAILAQCSYLSMIGKEVENIISLCSEDVKITKERKPKSKTTANKETEKAA